MSHRVAVLVGLGLHPEFPVLNCCVSGPSVFYRGKTWYSDGTILEIGDFTVTADMEVTGVDVMLDGNNDQLADIIRAREYRGLVTQIILARIDGSGTVSRARQFIYYGDSHSVEDDGTFIFHLTNIFSQFEQMSNTRSSGSDQRFLVSRGLLGTPGEEDRAFDRASLDYTSIGIGERRARVQKTKTGIWPFRKTIRTTIPGKEASPLKDDGSDYRRDIALGSCVLEGNLISAWNPDPSRVTSVISGWNSVPAGTENNSRFVVLIYAVAEGELADLTVFFSNLDVSGRHAFVTIGDTTDTDVEGWKYPVLTGGQRVCAVQARLGSRHSQTAFSDITSMANDTDIWSDEHIGYGTALVAIVAQASDLWDGSGVPEVYFKTTRGMLLNLPDGTRNWKSHTPGDINPAWALYDVITSGIYGRGIGTSQLNTSSFETALASRWGASLEFNHMWINGYLEGTLSVAEKVKRILDAGSLFLTFDTAGRLTCRARELPSEEELRRARTEYHFDPSRRGKIEGYETGTNSETYNRISVKSSVVTQSLETDDFEIVVQDEAALRQDNYQPSTMDASFPLAGISIPSLGTFAGVPNSIDLERLARLGEAELDRSRLGQRGSFKVPVWTVPDLMAGDIITISDPKIFGEIRLYARVVRLTIHPPALMSVDWVEFSPLIYFHNSGVDGFRSGDVTIPSNNST